MRPHAFYSEEEEEKALLLNITNYFQAYEYDSNLKSRLVIYHLQANAALWREQAKMMHNIKE